VDQFTRTVALELADRGVRVNAVNPGVIVTDIHKRGGMSEQDYQQVSCGERYVCCVAPLVAQTLEALTAGRDWQCVCWLCKAHSEPVTVHSPWCRS
jgi:NAD(P)-dependent dehydrogenase (short-subunit alcohol dehydrogenase family)